MGRALTATGIHPELLRRLAAPIEIARKFSGAQRQDAAKSGIAMSDGSYPIYNRGDLQNAYLDYLRTGKAPAVKSHLEKRAKALNAPSPFEDN